jgi:hypothetical protein
MSKILPNFKKITLFILVFGIGFAALPAMGASAAGLSDVTPPPVSQPDNSRIENIWARAQNTYQREGDRLAKAGEFISTAQTLINKANQKGWDTSLLQAALNAFASVIPAAQAAHDSGASIIANHAGFDAAGKVTDRTAAIDTVKALSQVLKDTRSAMNGTGKALREAIRSFRQTHRSGQATNPSTP